MKVGGGSGGTASGAKVVNLYITFFVLQFCDLEFLA